MCDNLRYTHLIFRQQEGALDDDDGILQQRRVLCSVENLGRRVTQEGKGSLLDCFVDVDTSFLGGFSSLAVTELGLGAFLLLEETKANAWNRMKAPDDHQEQRLGYKDTLVLVVLVLVW